MNECQHMSAGSFESVTLTGSQDLPGHTNHGPCSLSTFVSQSAQTKSRFVSCSRVQPRGLADQQDLARVGKSLSSLVDAAMGWFQGQELQSEGEFGGIRRGRAGDEVLGRRGGGAAGPAGGRAAWVSSSHYLAIFIPSSRRLSGLTLSAVWRGLHLPMLSSVIYD